MSPSLIDKLRMMDADDKPKSAGDGPSRSAPPVQAPETPSSREAASCLSFKEAFPLSLFGDRSVASPATLSAIFGLSVPRHLTESNFLFLDTETTGLSGGVGTVAFQVGVGYFENRSFVVEQFFIRDYHEEPFMLSKVAALCRRFPLLVTFNGRAFDGPLLQSRMRMNRLDVGSLPDLHADMLFPSRRLWKLRLKSCRLSHLEEDLLGVFREDDLESALVPQTFFKYLKDRDFAPIERILAHNRQDIVSLAQLFFFLCKEYSRPEGITHQEDLLSLARMHEKQGRAQQAVKCYRLCAHGETRPMAFQALAVHAKRQGQVDNAIRLYTAMLGRGEEPVMCCEALAKLYEHQKKDIEKALHYTRQGLLLLAEPGLKGGPSVQERRNALQYRYARLKRKPSSLKQEGFYRWDS